MRSYTVDDEDVKLHKLNKRKSLELEPKYDWWEVELDLPPQE